MTRADVLNVNNHRFPRHQVERIPAMVRAKPVPVYHQDRCIGTVTQAELWDGLVVLRGTLVPPRRDLFGMLLNPCYTVEMEGNTAYKIHHIARYTLIEACAA